MNQAYINMLKDPDPGDQYYSYGQRLHQFNQTERLRDALKECIETGVQSNRLVVQIWDKEHDLEQPNPPCFQFLQCRLREENLVGAVTLFRSHCFVNADFANYGAIIKYLIDEVVEPAGGELSELINVSTSAQIGKGEVDTVFDAVGNWMNLNSFFNSYNRVW
jgi:Thymidylate synthase